MDRQDIENLLDEVNSLKEEDPDSIVYEDSEERLSLLLFLYDLLQEARSDSDGQVRFQEIDREDFRFIKLRNALEELDKLGYIDYLIFGLGGNGGFQICEKYDFQRWIEIELENTRERIRGSDEGAINTIKEQERTDVVADLKRFTSFIEENGFKAFWDSGYISGKIRRQPEEIGRCLLMAYLASLRGYSAREVPSGSGRQDIVHIEETLVPTIIEAKVLQRKNRDRYDEGIMQLKNYAKGQNVEAAYYLIFQKGDLYQDEQYERDGLKIIQLCANIKPEAPTS